uniref:Ig-like domain-containing protein n=2 Tax=Dendroctonus ponderosae TaxID=77166 RepID=A0AAR5PYJ6_DENPD
LQSLKEVLVKIPEAVRLRDTVSLQCNYDLEGETLYTVKWYKGSNEFYRFIPKEHPDSKVFPLPGIYVDVSESTPNEVVLRNVELDVTGKYNCEVSSDFPSFDTKVGSAFIYVVDPPEEDPLLVIDKHLVDMGDYIKANCSTYPSHPASNISWYLNGKNVLPRFVKKLEVTPEFLTGKRKYYRALSGVEIEVTESTFQDGKAILSCVATIFKIYKGEKKETLEDARPRPRPSSVLGPRDYRSDNQRLEISKMGFLLTLLLVHAPR